MRKIRKNTGVLNPIMRTRDEISRRGPGGRGGSEEVVEGKRYYYGLSWRVKVTSTKMSGYTHGN